MGLKVKLQEVIMPAFMICTIAIISVAVYMNDRKTAERTALVKQCRVDGGEAARVAVYAGGPTVPVWYCITNGVAKELE